MVKIQVIKHFRIVRKKTAEIVATVNDVDFGRFPEREYRHIPVWEDE